MSRWILLLFVLVISTTTLPQQDSLREAPGKRGGGNGDGSGGGRWGGRGDGSGGGRRLQEPTPSLSPAAPTKARTPVPMRTSQRQRFAGVFSNAWQHDARLPEDGIDAPAALLIAYTRARGAARRVEASTRIVDTLLATGTSAALYAWGDSLRAAAALANDSASMAKALLARGSALIREGRLGRAFDDLRAALTWCDEHKQPALAATIHASIGDGLMRMGGSTGALKRYEEVLRIDRSSSIPPQTRVDVLTTVAFIHEDLGHPDSAAIFYDKAETEARLHGLARLRAKAIMGQADLLADRGRPDSAIMCLDQAIALLASRPDRYMLLEAREARGIALLMSGRNSEARAELRTAIAIADSLNAPFNAARARIYLADAMGADNGTAFKLLKEADRIGSANGIGIIGKEVMLSMSERYARMGRLREAHDLAMHAVHVTDSLNMAFWEQGARRQMQRSQLALKDRELDDLEEQGAEQKARATAQEGRIARQRVVIIAAVVAALSVFVLALIAWRAYRSQRRTADELARAHAEVLRQKQRAEESERAKDRFLANVSHEIRTPLNAIMGFSTILLEDERGERSARYLRSIKDAGGNLMAVINDVLDISRIEAGRLTLVREHFDLHARLAQCADLLQHRADEQDDLLILEIDPDTPRWVEGDGARLAQVLINLLGNALKFTQGGEVRLKAMPSGGSVRFTVSDTGIGIPKDKVGSIFDRFTQVDANDQRLYGGTGLGLAIVSELVRLQNGTVTVQSEPGRGTIFAVELPLPAVTAPTTGAPQMQRASNGSLSGRTILIAEDNDLNATVTVETLKRRFPSSIIERVNNGREAVDRVVEVGDRIGLVMMDVQMPVLDGLSATRELRSQGARLPVIALTASVLPSDLSMCLAAGMDACVSKPFRVEDLIDAIHRATGDAGSAPERSHDGPDHYAALFAELVPARLGELRAAHQRGDAEEVQRLVHIMRPQLVHRDEQRFAPICDAVLTFKGNGDFNSWHGHVERAILAIEETLG